LQGRFFRRDTCIVHSGTVRTSYGQQLRSSRKQQNTRMQRHIKHLDFPPSRLRTRRSGVRISPGAPFFSCSINHLARQVSSSRICSAYCAVISLFSCPSQNFRMSSSTPYLAMIEDRKRRNACAAFPGSLIPSFFIEGVRCRCGLDAGRMNEVKAKAIVQNKVQ
jgi:hypothetical protein